MPSAHRATPLAHVLHIAVVTTLYGWSPTWAMGQEPAAGAQAPSGAGNEAEAQPSAAGSPAAAGTAGAPAGGSPDAAPTGVGPADAGSPAGGSAEAQVPAEGSAPAKPEAGGPPQAQAAPGGSAEAKPDAGGPPQAQPAPGGSAEAKPDAGGSPQAQPAPGGSAEAKPDAGGSPQAQPAPVPAPAAGPFRSTAEFTAALKKYCQVQAGIAHLCEALGLPAASLEPRGASPAQEKVLEQARAAANLGPGVDEALLAARGLLMGQDQARILADIRRRREELAVFHGLAHGPAQDRVGPDKTLKATFRHYGLDALVQVRPVALALDAGTAPADLRDLLAAGRDRVFLANLREDGGAGHFLALRVDPAGAGMLVYDGGEWSQVPLDQAFGVLRNYAELTGSPRPYVAVDVYPVPAP